MISAGKNTLWSPTDFGASVIPAAEWDAQQKRDTIPAPSMPDGYDNAAVMRDCGQTVRLADGPIISSFGTKTITVTDESARVVLPDSITTKLAIAMFEADHAGTIARVTDGGKESGISVDEARQRLVWRSGEDQRAQYLKEAAELLKRAGEL